MKSKHPKFDDFPEIESRCSHCENTFYSKQKNNVKHCTAFCRDAKNKYLKPMEKLNEEQKQEIRDLIRNEFSVISKDDKEKIGLDSLSMIELVIEVERKLNIIIADNEVENVKSTNDLFVAIEISLNK
jgi:acyl carrier protein